jgi:hypothetical protein
MPVVTVENLPPGRRRARQWLTAALLTGTVLSQTLSPAIAADYSTGVSKEGATNWQWWHAIWFQKDGNPRYASGAGSLSRNHEKRLMVRPPLCEPEFGYFQPCWRQLPVSQRCFTCESVPQNYALPPYESGPVHMPPAPSGPPPMSPADPLPPVPSGTPPAIPAPTGTPTGIGAAAMTDFPLPRNP